MRYIYLSLIVAVAVVVLAFKIQNLATVTVSLFGTSITVPTSLLVIGVYILGMLTGGPLVGLVRGWIQGARAK
jgi:uncharacterized integral membrane protein